MAAVNKLFGRIEDRLETQQYISTLRYPVMPRRLLRQDTPRDVFLWQVLPPGWTRLAQGIGDCVSHGAALAGSILVYELIAKGMLEAEPGLSYEVSPEATYGGCRVEVNGGRSPLGSDDGALGSWAAQWLNKWGVLLMQDYSSKTGNKDHDLRQYIPQRASAWGVTGCGGKQDQGLLDEAAKLHPVQEVTPVRTTTEMSAAIDAGCTCTIASDVDFEAKVDQRGFIVRDENGVCRAGGNNWPHQMCVLGKKFIQGVVAFRIFNSWGHSTTGPDPGIDNEEISKCSWWCVEKDMRRILAADDSFALSNVKGFEQPPFDFANTVLV